MTTTPDSVDALPCPFCGHVGLIFREGSTFRWGLAECASCEATAGEVRKPPSGDWKSNAIAAWNRRAATQVAAGALIVPEGWKLTLVQPTREMYLAACHAFTDWHDRNLYPERYSDGVATSSDWTHEDVFRAMLAATPQPPALSAPQGGPAVGRVDEDDDGLFVEILQGPDGSSLKLGDMLYAGPQSEVAQQAPAAQRYRRADPELVRLMHELDVIARTTLHAHTEGSPRARERDCVRRAMEVIRMYDMQAPAAVAAPDQIKNDKRYRWLRDYHIGDDPEAINLSMAPVRGLDAAIDAAIAAQEGGV